jgi:hypothetical protein
LIACIRRADKGARGFTGEYLDIWHHNCKRGKMHSIERADEWAREFAKEYFIWHLNCKRSSPK